MEEKQPAPKLPEFEKPPVNEVVIGVQFDPIENFGAVHPGMYWQRIRNRYPKVQDRNPLDSVYEFFGPDKLPKPVAKLTTMLPIRRCWFLDDSETALVQVQPERFIRNWRKVTGKECYPRYSKIREDFKGLWDDFLRFVDSEKLGKVSPNHWELTYVNHMYSGHEWNSFGDLSGLFPFWTGKGSTTYLPIPDRMVLNLTFSFPKQLGRLHVSLEPHVDLRDGRNLLRLALTARGQLKSSDTEELLRMLDHGHEWIVNGFTDLTSTQAHELWKRKQ